MGTRRTLVTAAPGRLRDARGMTLPPLPAFADDSAWKADVALGERDDWKDDRAFDDEDVDLYATLHLPETAAHLDLTGVVPAAHAETERRHEGSRPARSMPARASGQTATRMRSRMATASRRLSDVGKMRPVVRIPGKGRGDTGSVASRTAKLPPVWVLANLAILLMASLAVVVPHALQADAAAGCDWYTVRAGDTLGNIGWAHHMGALTLAKANSIANPDLIYVGQRLCIPVKAGAHSASAPAVPKTTTPPKLGTPNGVQQFVSYVLPYARSAHQQTGWPTSLILAQWGVEQGWHLPSYTGYNFGNCGAIPGEPTIGGLNVPGSPARFSYAKTPEDGLRQYVHVAHLGYYSAVAPAAKQSGVDAAAWALGRSPWDAGHYTNTGNPGSSLLNVLHTYNLYQYD